MKLRILQIRKSDGIVEIATINLKEEIPIKRLIDEHIIDEIWHGCNVHCWDRTGDWEKTRKVKLSSFTLEITEKFCGVANSDIIITDENFINFVAESKGWRFFSSLEEATEYRKSKPILFDYIC